jgi:hypothetical protein
MNTAKYIYNSTVNKRTRTRSMKICKGPILSGGWVRHECEFVGLVGGIVVF